MRNCFLPPQIGQRIPGHPVEREQRVRLERTFQAPLAPGTILVYTAGGREIEPGSPSDPTDQRVIEAHSGLNATLALLGRLGETFGSNGLVATVHYGRDYDNAFWDGKQMVFGDGDQSLFLPFTKPIDVCSHELGHGVTGDLLDYQDQAGALNESLSDAQGATTRQAVLKLDVMDPNAWLIGAKGELLADVVIGKALRDMLNPGTAFDDPELGKDDQPDHMSGYFHTDADNGGVHTNSGIPNRAFALAAQALGNSELALAIWRDAVETVGDPSCTFTNFARQCVAMAETHKDEVRQAWEAVGVLQPSSPAPSPTPTPGGSPSGEPFPGANSEVARRIVEATRRKGVSQKDWMNHHFRHYFNIR